MVLDDAYDLAICDIMMPGEDGLSLCRHLQATTDTPVILLTALGDDADRIIGLEIGADDYVAKPFNPRELLARVKTVMRRTQEGPPPSRIFPAARNFEFDRWKLFIAQRELLGPDGLVVTLSTGECALLKMFLDKPGQVLSRQDLLNATRSSFGYPEDRRIDNQISRLRRKIEADPKSPRIIKTVWGGGYSFVARVKLI